MNQTVMYQITGCSRYMMSFVIVTKENHAIVIDGGRKEDMPLLKQYIGGRHILAWILTHAHDDHISGFVSEWEENGAKDFGADGPPRSYELRYGGIRGNTAQGLPLVLS